MSKYTTELRFICETLCGYTESQGLSKVEEIISKSAPLIFDFDYPIFDENYKIPLEKKIIRHYYLREIGFETLGIWKLKLNDKLNEIMPYFNQLYKSELLKFNPLVDVDVKTTSNTAGKGQSDFSQTDSKNTTEHSAFEESKSGTSTTENKTDGTLTNASSSSNSGTTSDTSNASKSYDDYDDYSDTPQGSVGNLTHLTYLTNARHKHGNSSDTTTAKGTSTGELTSSSTDTSKSTGTNKETTAGTESTTNDKTFNSSDNMSSNTNTTNTQDYLENIIGKRGGQTYSAMLSEFRKTFLNIDKMLMDELSDLFMTIY